ncbi:hypothetical protein [Pseudomonas oryzihabitans]|uniref:hypothetical protein n=1 Tax=Pseudomonas oryzihabitans TaxID=47885 RepID=UPI00289AFC77|nr:hypothetical protein [Pseudomonas oryzihabitans]
MTKKTAQGRTDYEAITSISPLTNLLDTASVFDEDYEGDHLSPLDQYIKNTNAVNLAWLRQDEISTELANIVLLGYVSAIESYMRALIRGLINIDETSRQLVESKTISFAAALHHKKDILPEALLEEISFASSANIKNTIGSCLGVGFSNSGMDAYFDEFDKISHLRHCCTHRFGKLGTKNAVALGLSQHTKFLEKPVKLSRDNLESIADTLRNFIKSLNNYVFRVVMGRTVNGGKTSTNMTAIKIVWSWTYRSDKSKFIRYYRVFSTTLDAVPSPSALEVYKRFMLSHKPKGRRG